MAHSNLEVLKVVTGYLIYFKTKMCDVTGGSDSGTVEFRFGIDYLTSSSPVSYVDRRTARRTGDRCSGTDGVCTQLTIQSQGHKRRNTQQKIFYKALHTLALAS